MPEYISLLTPLFLAFWLRIFHIFSGLKPSPSFSLCDFYLPNLVLQEDLRPSQISHNADPSWLGHSRKLVLLLDRLNCLKFAFVFGQNLSHYTFRSLVWIVFFFPCSTTKTTHLFLIIMSYFYSALDCKEISHYLIKSQQKFLVNWYAINCLWYYNLWAVKLGIPLKVIWLQG